MCSSCELVVQSTIVTASMVRGSAPNPTTTSLPRPWARAAAVHRSATPSETASSAFTRRMRCPPVPSVQLVEREAEARDERVQEIADLRQVETLHARPQRLLGLGELGVAGAGLLEALEVGAELVGRLHQVAGRAIARVGPEERLVARPRRGWTEREELFPRRGLGRGICALDLGNGLLHRRGQSA